ncbi:hypothetical protein MMC13_008264 [Lambiella insularis]|nr:hypothetical protein [Lambiella insularis]
MASTLLPARPQVYAALESSPSTSTEPALALALLQLKSQSVNPEHTLTTTFPPPTTPPRRPFLLRALTLTTLGLVLTTTTFLMAASPALPSLPSLLFPPSTPPAYYPPDALSASINTHLLTHPLAVSLRANPAFTESRPHMHIPAAMRAHSLTAGTLAGPGRLVVPPIAFLEQGGKSIVCFFYLGEDLCGYPGVVHGGLLATILDEGLARCCFPALQHGVGVTASLKIEYRRPVAAGGYVVLRAWTRKVEGRKAWVEGRLEELGEEGEGEVLAEAEALFVEPRQAKAMARLYPAGKAAGA